MLSILCTNVLMCRVLIPPWPQQANDLGIDICCFTMVVLMDVINRLMLRNPEAVSFVVGCWLVQTYIRNDICQDMAIVPASEVRWGQSVDQHPSVCTYVRTYINTFIRMMVSGHDLKKFSLNYFKLSMCAYWSIFGPMAKYLAPWWAKNGANLRFPNINWKGLHSINFKPCWCAYWGRIHFFL